MTTIEDVLAGRAKWCVEHSRCEAFSSALPDGSVNLLWLDPPYFRVVDEEWDRAWKTEADFLVWLRSIVAEAARVLAPNGSLYLFASPQMGGRVECIAREHLDVLNHLVWAKRQGWQPYHADTNIILESPKLYVYKPKIRLSVAKCLGLPEANVSIKARTREGLGPEGEGLAVTCEAVVSMRKETV